MSKLAPKTRKKQQGFFKELSKKFGGHLLGKGNPKSQRPLNSKKPIHLSIKANKGVLALPKTFNIVSEIVKNVARKYGFTVYRDANVGNHLHLLIKIQHRWDWSPYIRELTGRIAMEIREVLPDLEIEKFWKSRPYTRIVDWGRDFDNMKIYVHVNELERRGLISRKEIKGVRDMKAFWELVHGTS